jgi:hypothetical protein
VAARRPLCRVRFPVRLNVEMIEEDMNQADACLEASPLISF